MYLVYERNNIFLDGMGALPLDRGVPKRPKRVRFGSAVRPMEKKNGEVVVDAVGWRTSA